MPGRTRTLELATLHLQSSDHVMERIIAGVGPVTLRLERNRFGMLVRSVLSQQLSTKAARTIRRRVEHLTKGTLTAEGLRQVDKRDLRAAGVSERKAECLLALAEADVTSQIRFNQLGRYSDESVIEQLTQVKGIGRWTAQMFLIFALGRLDVLPHDDLGVRAAVRNEYELDGLPDKETIEEIAKPWRPYASVASWYCWRTIDNARDPSAARGNPSAARGKVVPPE